MKTHIIGLLILIASLFSACANKDVEPKFDSKENIATAHEDESASTLLKSMDDLKNKRIGVLMSSIQDLYITSAYPDADIKRIDMAPDLIMSLKSHQVDAIVLLAPEATEAIKLDNSLGILNPDIYTVKLGFAFREEGLRNSFNTFLEEIQLSGLYEDMVARWIDDFDHASMPKLNLASEKNPIIVGTTTQNLPFTFIQNGECSGFDIEFVSRFAEKQGRGIKFEIMSFEGLIPALNTGKIDIIASSAMITPERAEQVMFSNPYYTVGSTVLALKKNLAKSDKGMKDGSELETARIGAMTGTIGEFYVEEHFLDAKLLLFDDINDAIVALRSKQVDYVITAYTTALLASRHNTDIALLPEKYINEPAAAAVRQGNYELVEKMNAVINRMKVDGSLDDLIGRWLEHDGGEYKGPKNPAAADAPVLKVGVAANREPMCFVRNNKIVGLDCELIETIAADLGMRVEYLDMKFSTLINAIESGRADVIVSNLTVTQERQEKVLFTVDYFYNPQIMITLKGANDIEQAEDTPGFFAKIKDSFYNNLVREKRWKLIVNGLKATLIITIFAALLGTIIGALVCAMRMSRNRLVKGIARLYIDIMRGTPILVMLMILFYVVFASTGLSAIVVAIITFALNMAAYSSEMFRTSIESVDPGQKEAGLSMGFTKVRTFIYIILPQAVRKVIPVYKGEVISLLKMTSIVGYIAVVDLTKASDIIRSRTFDAFFPLIVVAIIYFILSWLLGLGLDYINRKVSSAS